MTTIFSKHSQFLRNKQHYSITSAVLLKQSIRDAFLLAPMLAWLVVAVTQSASLLTCKSHILIRPLFPLGLHASHWFPCSVPPGGWNQRTEHCACTTSTCRLALVHQTSQHGQQATRKCLVLQHYWSTIMWDCYRGFLMQLCISAMIPLLKLWALADTDRGLIQYHHKSYIHLFLIL